MRGDMVMIDDAAAFGGIHLDDDGPVIVAPAANQGRGRTRTVAAEVIGAGAPRDAAGALRLPPLDMEFLAALKYQNLAVVIIMLHNGRQGLTKKEFDGDKYAKVGSPNLGSRLTDLRKELGHEVFDWVREGNAINSGSHRRHFIKDVYRARAAEWAWEEVRRVMPAKDFGRL